jgi:hypothetical protein
MQIAKLQIKKQLYDARMWLILLIFGGSFWCLRDLQRKVKRDNLRNGGELWLIQLHRVSSAGYAVSWPIVC